MCASRRIGAGDGNDTIVGGSGQNTVDFDTNSSDATITTHHGVTTVKFTDGQDMTITDVQELVFTNKTVHI